MISQTPWLQRSFHFNFPLSHFPIIFSRLEGTLFRIHMLLQAADDERCSIKNNGWSVKEHVGHLYDLEELWWQRMTDFLQYKEALTAADMTNSKTEEAKHNEKALEELVNAFTIERQRILEVIYSYDEGTLNRTSCHPRLNVPFRLIDSLYFVAEHDDHHIALLSNLLRHIY
ncbi:MAG TPA: DinB family protein [Chitinophagaceae bacterium]|nr:DinB family protein [Chitinophagaceae bacterium]